MDVLFRISAGKDGLKKAGTICVSALFRPVPAVAKTGRKNDHFMFKHLKRTMNCSGCNSVIQNRNLMMLFEGLKLFARYSVIFDIATVLDQGSDK